MNLEVFLEKLGPTAVVLDLGCGNGSFDYSKYKFKIKAIDIVQPKKEFPKNVEFIKVDARKIPFKDKTFDGVVANWTLEHFYEPDKVLEEIGRVIKDEGFFFCSIPNGASFDDRLYRFLYRFNSGGHVNIFSFDSFLNLVFEKSNLKAEEYCEWYSGFTYIIPPKEAKDYPKATFIKLGRFKISLKNPITILGYFPLGFLFFIQRFLVRLTHFLDRHFGTRFGLCGWLFIFRRNAKKTEKLPTIVNVCRKCGAGYGGQPKSKGLLSSLGWKTYECPSCQEINDYC